MIVPEPTQDGALEKSFRNLPDVLIAYAGGLGTYELLWADRVLFTAAALDAIEARFAGTAAAQDRARNRRRREVTA